MRDYQRSPQPKITDPEAFRTFAQQHGHRTQQAMAEHWPDPISDWTIGKAQTHRADSEKRPTGRAAATSLPEGAPKLHSQSNG